MLPKWLSKQPSGNCLGTSSRKVIWETDLLHIAPGSLGIDSVHIKIYDRIIALGCAGKESTPGTSLVSHE